MMTQQEVEAFFLNHNDPVYEQIQDAATDGKAECIAADALLDDGIVVDPKDLIETVRKIRDA